MLGVERAERHRPAPSSQSLKKMLRCRLRLSGVEVHSYEQNAVNLPGWLFSSAILTFSFQTVPATFGCHERLDRRARRQLEQVQRRPAVALPALFGSFMISGCASGSLLT